MTNPADIPLPLPWEQRAKAVGTMPGGKNYIDGLRTICGHVALRHPSGDDLVIWIQSRYGVSDSRAKQTLSFLRKARILEQGSRQLNITEFASHWFETGDDGILIALLHSRLQFMGEMLAELRIEPRTSEELRQTAGRYGLTWDRRDQITRRRCWLQSAQLVKQTNTGRLAITDAGIKLLTKLELHQPPENPTSPRPFAIPPPPATLLKASTTTTPQPDVPRPDEPITNRSDTPAEALAAEIRSASTDSKNPDRLELAIRDAFQFLGFDAEKLGGSGKTDVLAKALLGKDDSYSVAIDAKTVGAGSLGDGQVDWVTLDEHKRQHNADYSMLVGPNPSRGRLMTRAVDQSVAVLSTDQLAELCLQHADAPLGLQDYRSLFEAGGAVDMTPISRSAQELSRIRDLAAELCAKLAERTSTFGPLTSSQLMVILDQPDKPSSEHEIQKILDTLSSPIVGAVQGTASEGYILATAPRVIQQRLHQLGEMLAFL